MEINNNLSKGENTRRHEKSIIIDLPRRYAYRIITVILAVVCYMNSLDGDFIHDDVYAIKNNGDVTGANPVWDLFYNDFWGKSMLHPASHKSYRPLTVLTFRLNYWLSQGTPHSFHVINVCLHAIMTFLFTYACAVAIRLPETCALMAGSLFAVHPIHTEAVAGVVGRADILAGIFFMTSFILYTKSIEECSRQGSHSHSFPGTSNPSLLLCSMICASLSMLSKEHGITVLGVCWIYDVFTYSRRGMNKDKVGALGPLLKRTLSVFMVGSLLVSFRLWIMGGQLPKFIHQDNPASFSDSFLTRCLSYPYIWYYNIRLLVAPTTLCYDWQVGSIPLVESFNDLRNLATLGFFLSLAVLSARWIWAVKNEIHSVPYPIFSGLLLLVLPFLPASNILFRVGFVIAERVLYIPSCGFCILLAHGTYTLYHNVSRSFSKDAISALFISLFLVMSLKTWKQNQVWYSRETLFRSGIQAIPHNAKIHYNYANHLKDIDDIKHAEIHYREAIRLYPTYASAHNNLGTILEDETEADIHFREALKLVPNHKGALVNLGSSLFKRGEKSEGIRLIQRVLELDPRYTEAVIILAGMNAETENFEKAEEYYRLAIELDPENPELLHHYGKFLSLTGDLEGAVTYYRKAFLKQSPDQWTPMVNAAQALSQLGRMDEAENVLKRALTLRREASALDLLGMVYYKQGRMSDTVNTYEEIRKTDPHNHQALMHYSQVLAGIGDVTEAEKILTDALQYYPNNMDLLSQMTNILGQQGKHKEALSYLERAIRLVRYKDSDILHNMLFQQGNHFKDLKMYQQALKSYNETVQINPRNAKAHLNIGAIYHIQGVLPKARYHYSKVLELEPENSIAKDNFRKLKNLEKKHRTTA